MYNKVTHFFIHSHEAHFGFPGSHSPGTVLTPSTVKLAAGVPPLNCPEISPPQIISSPPAYHLDQNTN